MPSRKLTKAERTRMMLRAARSRASESIGINGCLKMGAHAPKPVTRVKVNLPSMEEIEAAARKYMGGDYDA